MFGYGGGVGRPVKTRNEVRRLRALLAREGALPAQVVGEVLADLDVALGELERARELLGRLQAPWRAARDTVLALAVLVELDESPAGRR